MLKEQYFSARLIAILWEDNERVLHFKGPVGSFKIKGRAFEFGEPELGIEYHFKLIGNLHA